MTKLMSILAASALALSLSSGAFAAGEKAQDQPAYPKTQDQTGAPPPAEQSKKYEEYLAALKKCQDVQDAVKQQNCIEQARQKYNRM
jgi:hypothetical protein